MSSLYRAVDIVTKSSAVPGILANSLLIYLIMTSSRTHIGNFRYLLIVFASYDIFLVILHFVLDPKIFVVPGIFAVVLDFRYGFQFLTCIPFILFMVPYAILITHLLYRYWVICEPLKIALFSKPQFVLSLTASVSGIYAFLSTSLYF
ncbi:hypothetical protein PMAYCL1PPCAC_22931 [Pristionchus mayeri]|uniref:G protein-coupled receptor n=1 Tax=Pristionchus mayeri TaxID=1317129 RepID=A0AAN5CXW5_9BILA|nr:hypothetical protein PMAYCL1PPCAC_22931 [Pristionchus mayeri]